MLRSACWLGAAWGLAATSLVEGCTQLIESKCDSQIYAEAREAYTRYKKMEPKRINSTSTRFEAQALTQRRHLRRNRPATRDVCGRLLCLHSKRCGCCASDQVHIGVDGDPNLYCDERLGRRGRGLALTTKARGSAQPTTSESLIQLP